MLWIMSFEVGISEFTPQIDSYMEVAISIIDFVHHRLWYLQLFLSCLIVFQNSSVTNINFFYTFVFVNPPSLFLQSAHFS